MFVKGIAALYIPLSPNNRLKISLKTTKNPKTQKSPLFTKNIIPKILLKTTKNHNPLKKPDPKTLKTTQIYKSKNSQK